MCLRKSQEEDMRDHRERVDAAVERFQVSLISGNFELAAKHLDADDNLLFNEKISVTVPEAYVIGAQQFVQDCGNRGIALNVQTPRLQG